MKGLAFISGGFRMKSRAVVVSTAVSFFIIITALAVASGFRTQIRGALADVCGDLRVVPAGGLAADASSLEIDSSLPVFDSIAALPGVRELRGVIYRGGVVRSGEEMHGVLFRGVPLKSDSWESDGCGSGSGAGQLGNPGADTLVTIPSKLASLLSLSEGDKVVTYFPSDEGLSVRKFTVEGIYDGLVTSDDLLVVHCPAAVLRRLSGWEETSVSAVEIVLEDGSLTEDRMEDVAGRIDELLYLQNCGSREDLRCERLRQTYSTLFDWLVLIDSNVSFILVLMIIVAAFNLITGLLVYLFQNMKNIGLLKSLGMSNGHICRIFLLSAGRTAFLGMVLGNLAALAFCLLQDSTSLLKLNPDNYFISFVPVNVDVPAVLLVDAGALLIIILSLLLPCRFIARVQPSVILRAE